MCDDTEHCRCNEEMGIGAEEGEVVCQRISELISCSFELDGSNRAWIPCTNPSFVEVAVMKRKYRLDTIPIRRIGGNAEPTVCRGRRNIGVNESNTLCRRQS